MFLRQSIVKIQSVHDRPLLNRLWASLNKESDMVVILRSLTSHIFIPKIKYSYTSAIVTILSSYF